MMTDQYYQAEYEDPPERGRRRQDADDPHYSYAYAADADDDVGTEDGYGPVPAIAGHGRVSVAETGRAAARRIRFDPTQERGAIHYDRAHRHSRVVRGLKLVLPALALVGVIGFLAFVHFAPTPDEAVITLSGINVEERSVTMDKPHVSGFEGTRRAYDVRAEHAVQDLNNPKVMTMHTITARIGMEDGQTAHVQARTGRYDGDTRKLFLSDGIALRTTNGYRATLQEAHVDIGTSDMTSDKPVQIVTGQGTVKANAVVVKNNGKHVIFSKGVNVVYTPPDEEPEATAAPAPAAGTAADPGTIPAADAPPADIVTNGGAT